MAKLNWQALLAIFTLTLSVFPELFDLIMLANYGDPIVVAGAGLGVMFINMFVYGTFEGLNGAIDTLVSQYFGAKDYTSCNRIYNKARIINTVIFVPISLILIFSDKLLILLDQDPEVAVITQRFVTYQLPGLYSITMYDTLRRFLQAQGSFELPVIGLVLTNIFHIVSLALALKYIEYDPVIITALITNVSMIFDFLILRYLAANDLVKTNFLSIFDGAFDDWREYLGLALPSAFIICAEWWMYEVLAIFAGLLGVMYLSVIVIIFNTHNFVYDISYGLSQAASSMIGRTLAESGKFEAKKLLASITLIQTVLCIIMTTIYLTCSRQIINTFSDDEKIIDLYMDCNLLIISMFLIDSTQIVIGGVIRGLGEQEDSSIISFVAYALITLPMSLLLSFYFDFNIKGILFAYIMGIVFNSVFNIYLLYKSDWELAIEETIVADMKSDTTI